MPGLAVVIAARPAQFPAAHPIGPVAAAVRAVIAVHAARVFPYPTPDPLTTGGKRGRS